LLKALSIKALFMDGHKLTTCLTEILAFIGNDMLINLT
jgi:hypothetical protein